MSENAESGSGAGPSRRPTQQQVLPWGSSDVVMTPIWKKLPFDIQNEIWKHLGEDLITNQPRVHHLDMDMFRNVPRSLDTPGALDTARYEGETNVPFGAGDYAAKKYFTRRQLRMSTLPGRWLGSICPASRAHAKRLLPDTLGLAFRKEREDGRKKKTKGQYRELYCVRVSKERDIFVIAAAQWERQVHFLRLGDEGERVLRGMRNIALNCEMLTDDRLRRHHKMINFCHCLDPATPYLGSWLPSPFAVAVRESAIAQDMADPGPCFYSCQRDPLLSFLSSLPDVKRFIIAAHAHPLSQERLLKAEEHIITRQHHKWKYFNDGPFRTNTSAALTGVGANPAKVREPGDAEPYTAVLDGSQAHVLFEVDDQQSEFIRPNGALFHQQELQREFPFDALLPHIRFQYIRP